uniref:protein kinase domain-containing protein n=1 Tax=Pseudonocardia pini TaxID=2758030 RepID=UPI0015F0FEDC
MSIVDPSTIGPDGPDPAAARPVPAIGTWVGPATEPARYALLERVGNGGEGELWRARRVELDGRPGDVVAVKVHRTADRATLNGIAEQARLLSGVPRDRHVVRVDQVFDGVLTRGGRVVYEDVPVVVMEWIDGSSPAALLEEEDVSVAARLSWIAQLATAVDTLHHGTPPLVHADIKPGNLLVDRAGRLVLVDTGAVARAGDGETRRPLHSAGWAAPEVRSRPRAGRSTESDLYSVGAVAYFLLTGERPVPEVDGEPLRESAQEQRARMRRTLLATGVVPRRRGVTRSGYEHERFRD